MIDVTIDRFTKNSIVKEDRIELRVTRKNYFSVISLTKEDAIELIKI